MRLFVPAGLLLFLMSSVPSAAQEPVGPVTITIEQLQQATVIGSIGQPLGMVVEIEATIIDGDETRLKLYSGQYLLRVDKVAGKPLTKPPLLTFGSAFSSNANLPSDGFELYERK